MMKQTFTLLALIFSVCFLQAQTTSTFEDFNLPVDSFWNGSDFSGGFESGNAFLPNEFTDAGTYTFWSGWSVSTITDVTTPGFTNEFSAITGSGFDGSTHYATTYVAGSSTINIEGAAKGGTVDGFYITNATYPFLSMKDGDSFAKKFGGVDGTDPDFFLLTIKARLDGQVGADSINFYLADYRDSDNSKDYIIADWKYVDLKSLGKADELIFTLSSSDIGQFGMNTPSYFCIDNLTTTDNGVSSSKDFAADFELSVYPNPTTDFLIVDWNQSQGTAQITDLQGRTLETQLLQKGKNTLMVSDLPKGVHFLQIKTEEKFLRNKRRDRCEKRDSKLTCSCRFCV